MSWMYHVEKRCSLSRYYHIAPTYIHIDRLSTIRHAPDKHAIQTQTIDKFISRSISEGISKLMISLRWGQYLKELVVCSKKLNYFLNYLRK